MQRKFLEHLSDLIYKHPESAEVVRPDTNSSVINVTIYQKPKFINDDYVIDLAAYRILIKVMSDRSNLSIQRCYLAQTGWVEEGSPFEENLYEEEHFLFKPLIDHILKKHDEIREKGVEKMQEDILSNNVQFTNPIYDLIKKKESNKKSKTFTGSDNPDLMEF